MNAIQFLRKKGEMRWVITRYYKFYPKTDFIKDDLLRYLLKEFGFVSIYYDLKEKKVCAWLRYDK